MIVDIEDDIMDPVMQCTTLPSHSSFSQKKLVSFVTEIHTLSIDISLRDCLDDGVAASFQRIVYTDSDYAGATQDRKSTTGGCQFLGNRLISWQCKKQTMVATSTTKAEYVAAANLLTKGFDAGSQKEVGTLRYLSLVVPLKKVGDEAVHKELGDRMERAATTASSLEAEQECVTAAELLTTVRHHLVLPVQVNAAEAKAKTVNGRRRLQALVDKKKVIITETSIRSDLHLEDAGGTDCLPTATIFEELARMGIPIPSNDTLLIGEDIMQLTELMILCSNLQKQVLDLEKAKDAQAKEIVGLRIRVQKLGRKKEIKNYKGRSFEDIDKDVEVSLVDETQGRSDDAKMFDTNGLHGDEVIVDMAVGEKQEQSAKVDEREVSTGVEDSVAPTIPVTTTAAKPKAVTTAATTTTTTRPKLKGRSYDEIQKLFDKEIKRVNYFVAMNSEAQEISGKKDERVSKKEKIAQDSKVEVDNEAELKKHMVTVKDDDIAIDAIPFATKPPVIVEYKLIRELIMRHYQLIKVNGSFKRYSSMIKMLQGIDREDLQTIWKLIKTKHGDTRPEDKHERVLWGDLKVMFELDIKSDVWRNLQGYKVNVWKLFDSYGVCKEVDIIKKTENQAKMTKLSMEWKRLLSVPRTSTKIFYVQISCSRIRTFIDWKEQHLGVQYADNVSSLGSGFVEGGIVLDFKNSAIIWGVLKPKFERKDKRLENVLAAVSGVPLSDVRSVRACVLETFAKTSYVNVVMGSRVVTDGVCGTLCEHQHQPIASSLRVGAVFITFNESLIGF
ncbi:putative ribonuclease H-like domain-containing protein [Tanacetum coccineum]